MDTRTSRRSFLAGFGGVGALSLMNLPVRAQDATLPDYYPADYDQIIEGSKSEGRLLIYSSMSPRSWEGIQNRVSQLYPWINVEVLELNSVEVMERYLAENGTGAPTCDFLCTASLDKWIQFMERGEILAYDSPEKAFFPDWSMPESGLYTVAADPLIIIYNKLLLSEDMRPKGIQDFARLVEANPDLFDGRIGIFGADGPTNGYLAHYAFAQKHGEQAWDWFAKIGPSTRSETSGGPAVEKVLSGEYVAGYFLSPGPAWLASKDPAVANVLGWDYIHDGTPLILRSAAIPAGARNVNTAKLWLDATLSFDGALALAAGARTPLRQGVTAADVNGEPTLASIAEAVGEDNVLATRYDSGIYSDFDAFSARWREVYARN